MVKKSSSSQSCKFTTTWLSSRFQNSSKIVKNSAHFERISQCKQRWRPPRGSSGHAYKEGDSSCQETHNSGILQQTVPGTQTLKRWRPVIDLSILNTHLHVPTFKMETAKSIRKSIRMGEWVTSVDLTISKISEISNQKRGFPISVTPFMCSNSSPSIYSDSERGKTHSSSQEPQNSSVFGQLASSVTHERTMSHRFPKLGKIGARTRLARIFKKLELVPTRKLDFLGYHFDLQRGLVFPTQKKLDQLKNQTVSIRKSLVLSPRNLMSLIGTSASLEKTNH